MRPPQGRACPVLLRPSTPGESDPFRKTLGEHLVFRGLGSFLPWEPLWVLGNGGLKGLPSSRAAPKPGAGEGLAPSPGRLRQTQNSRWIQEQLWSSSRVSLPAGQGRTQLCQPGCRGQTSPPGTARPEPAPSSPVPPDRSEPTRPARAQPEERRAGAGAKGPLAAGRGTGDVPAVAQHAPRRHFFIFLDFPPSGCFTNPEQRLRELFPTSRPLRGE